MRSAAEGGIVFEKIKKRDNRVVEFDSSKITAAIAKAGKARANSKNAKPAS
jgi:anaerobic ribonucleoside-triphosphate reductase